MEQRGERGEDLPQEHNILLSCAHHGEGDSHTGQKEEEKHDRTSSKRTSREQEKAERSAGSKGTEKKVPALRSRQHWLLNILRI